MQDITEYESELLQKIAEAHARYLAEQRRKWPELGDPLYAVNDFVEIKPIEYDDHTITEGVIMIVDRYGAFGIEGDHSYDIYSKPENLLMKHIPQKSVVKKIRDATPDDVPEGW